MRRTLIGAVLIAVVFIAGYTIVSNTSNPGANPKSFRDTASAGTPFLGTPLEVPGIIKATDFDNGGEGNSYHDTDASNNGGQYRQTGVDIERGGEGYNIGWVKPGEWIQYTINATRSGTYDITFRTASQSQSGQFYLSIDGRNVTGNVAVPLTGGNQAYKDYTVKGVQIIAGTHTMRLNFVNSTSPDQYMGNYSSITFTLASEIALSAPSNLSANTVAKSVTLTWKDTNNPKMSCEISRSTDNKNFEKIAVLFAGSSTYVDSDVVPDSTYYYQLKAVSGQSSSLPSSISVKTTATTPYNNTASTIPGTIKAADFDNGGEGVAYHDTDASNTGGQYRTTGVDIERSSEPQGYNIGWAKTGEWVKYTVHTTATGNYDLDFRVASPFSGGAFSAAIDENDITGTLAIPNTGNSQAYTTVSKKGVALTSGLHTLKITFTGADNPGGWAGNLASVKLTQSGLVPPLPATYNITASAGTGGFMSPSGTISALQGSTLTFNIYANSGYSIGDVKTDGISRGPASVYTFPNINSNHSIVASFNQTTAQTLNVPSNLSATAVSASQINLSWTDTNSNPSEMNYIVERSVDGLNYFTAATLGTNSTSFSNSGLSPGTTYYYRVFARGSGVSDSPKASVSAKTQQSGDIVWKGPIVITRGGIYSDNWKSTNPNVPAVEIKTSEPVTIINSRIASAGDVIYSNGYNGYNANLTLKNSYLENLNPGVAGKIVGRGIYLLRFKNFDVENNTFKNTGGIRIDEFQGGGTVKFLRNVMDNVEGRASDGRGGWQFPVIADGSGRRVTFQLVYSWDLAGAEIAWNQVINLPYQSRTEDNFNFFRDSGTVSSPIDIHDNYIKGAYPYDPVNEPYSGGGIMVCDTEGGREGTHYADVHDNIIVGTTNYGIGVACGHDNNVYNNRIISSGLLPDGQSRRKQIGDVGVFMWNEPREGNQVDPTWANIKGYNNYIAWKSGNRQWASSWLPDVAPGNWYGNTEVDAGDVTLVTENAEWTRWQNKLSASNIHIGASL